MKQRSWRPILLMVVGCLVVALAAFTLFVAIPYSRVPMPPEAAELDSVSLTPLAPGPRSDALVDVLGRSEVLAPDADQRLLGDLVVTLDDGSWFEDPAQLRARLASFDDFVEALLAAVQAPGCLVPRTSSPTAPGTAPVLPLLMGGRALAVTTVLRAQLDDGEQAARDLTTFLNGLHRLQDRCPNGLVVTLVLQQLMEHLQSAAGFLIADPLLPGEAVDDLARVLVAAETAPSRLPVVIRREWDRFQREMAGIRPAPSERESVAAARRMVGRCYSRLLWLAEQPPDAAALIDQTPEDAYMQALGRDHSPWIVGLRLGAGTVDGLQMGTGTIVADQIKLQAYHETRCRLARRRAGWLRDLSRRGRDAPAPLREPPPVSPFTGEPFDLEQPGSCRHPAETTRRGATTVPPGLPEPPAAHPVGPDDSSPAG